MSAVAQAIAQNRIGGRLWLYANYHCNLRCAYCMPEKDYVWLPREDVLTLEEMATLAGYFTDLGVDRVRLTGGEPLLRRGLSGLIRLLRQNQLVKDIALTTNGSRWLMCVQART